MSARAGILDQVDDELSDHQVMRIRLHLTSLAHPDIEQWT